MYFTHDQMIRGIKKLHPELVHGKDYLVIMGIEPDGTAASDAWIDRWPSGISVPTLQEVKDAYEEALAEQPTPVQQPETKTFPLSFFERFTEAEQLAIVTATMQVPQVKLWYDKLIAATEVVYADPRVSAGMDALVVAGLITQARSEQILPLALRTTGMQQV